MSQQAVELLEAELALIVNPTLREFATFTLERAPAYFTEVASSSTGKYHPEQSNRVPGGLINHTRATVVFALRLCRAYDVAGDEQDAVVVACLLHDLLKYSDVTKGAEVKQKHTTKTHDYDCALFVHKRAGDFTAATGKDVPQLSSVLGAIAWHMGRWTIRANPTHSLKKFPEEYTTHEIIVHLADMCSSEPAVSLPILDASLVG